MDHRGKLLVMILEVEQAEEVDTEVLNLMLVFTAEEVVDMKLMAMAVAERAYMETACQMLNQKAE